MQLFQRATTTFTLPSKSILLLLFWNFTIKFVYTLVFKTAVYLIIDGNSNMAVETILAIVFLCLAPVASFVADVKLGRFKTLVSSTLVVILSNSVLIVGVCGFFAVREFVLHPSYLDMCRIFGKSWGYGIFSLQYYSVWNRSTSRCSHKILSFIPLCNLLV